MKDILILSVCAVAGFSCLAYGAVSPSPAPVHAPIPSEPSQNAVNIGVSGPVTVNQGGTLSPEERATLYGDMHRLNEYITKRK